MPKHSRAPFLAFPQTPGGDRLGLRDRIYQACMAAILEGRFAPGQRLPSARELAADWRIARNTIDDALAQLQVEGFIERRVGDGTYVSAAIAARAYSPRHRAPTRLGKRALADASQRGAAAARDFSSRNTPRVAPFAAGLAALDEFPLDLWRRLVARRSRVAGTALLHYLPASGYPPLQIAIARHVATARGLRCAPENVMVLNSSMQAFDLIARVLVERDDVVWVEDPGYPNLRAVLAMAGARVVGMPVDRDGIDAGGARHPPALVCVTPSCHYPTGAVLSVPRRLALLRIVAERGGWIVEDDHQCEFTWSGRAPAAMHSLDAGGHTLYVNSFSHTMFPSLRLAYVVLPDSLIDVFHAVRRQLDDHTHGFMQAVLADFIDGGHFSAHVRRMKSLYAARRDVLLQASARHLEPFTIGATDCGLTATLGLPMRIADRPAAARAARAGLHVLPLSRYGVGAGRYNGWLLGYAALTERRIVRGVERLRAVLDAYPNVSTHGTRKLAVSPNSSAPAKHPG